MTFYIQEGNASRIKCDSFEEFVDYLNEMVITREEHGEDTFSVTVEET